jgi:UDP:flavonoid glycosyltransferase YjiC (YdhE family)
MSPRRRILFIGELVTLSHMVRPAVLAGTLDPQRYDIFFACDPRHLRLLSQPHPFRVVPLRSRLAAKSLEDVTYMRDSLYDFETVSGYVREDLRLFALYRPDVVVGDMRQSLVVSSRLAGMPFVNIQSAHWHPNSDTAFESPVSPFTSLVGEPLGTHLFNTFINVMMPLSALGINLAGLQHGLPPVGMDFKSVFSYGDYTAFPDLPQLSPLDPMPDNAAYVGPCLWSPQVARPAWWNELPRDRPVIYVGLGSSGQPRLLPIVIRALADLPVTLLLTTAGRADLGPQPPNVFVADYLDGLEAARAAQLTICNGGSMPVQQSLAGGTPVLGIASNIDQVAWMRLVTGFGAGEMIMETGVQEQGVRESVQRMLGTPSYRAAAGELAAAMERFDAAAAFNALLDRVFAERVAPRPARAVAV